MKLKTIGLALVATAFMASSALAAGMMAPIPNPPEKAKMKHHMMKHKAMAKAEAKEDKAEAKADMAKPAMPMKK